MRFAWLLLLPAVTGCSILPSFGPAKKPTEQVFYLDPPVSVASEAAADCGDILVTVPISAPGFSGARMIYSTEPLKLQKYAYARWADSIGRLMFSPLLEGLQAGGRFNHVVAAPSSVPTDYRLEITELQILQSYATSTAQSSTVSMNLQVRLYSSFPSKILNSRRIELSAAAAANPEDGAKAANRLAADLIAQVSEFAVSTCTGTASIH